MLYILKNNISLTFKLLIMGAKQIGWSNESNLLWDILNKINKLGGVIANLVTVATPKYKVYTALLTQSGVDNKLGLNSGSLTIGVTYLIDENTGGTDFTNVGSPNNNIGTYFVATGVIPNSWGTGGLIYDTGAPVVTVLENTIGNIWFTYNALGVGGINSDSKFIVNKTVAFGTGTGLGDDNIINFDLTTGPDSIFIYTLSAAGVLTVNYGSPIEIRVYN